ncbi:MAG TPA: glycyl-radical enzyme activating protein [Bacteroidales bacterium]
MKGIIYDIKHYAIHDGPGIRQTIFFKGCSLACWWCHNPEAISPKPFSFLKILNNGNKCYEKKETIGESYTIEEVMAEINKDRLFYEESGGGVTFSGGEPFVQYKFLLALLEECKHQGIHTCVDTTGHTDKDRMLSVAGLTDLFLYDLKHINSEQHKKYTGVGNELILENLKMLDEMGKKVWIRYPMIPGMNDQEEDLLRMLDFLSKLKNEHPVSILPYHKIGINKYQRFGIEYKMDGIEEPERERVEEVKSLFQQGGFEVGIGG